MKKYLSFIIVLLMLTAVISGCSSNEKSNTGNTQTQTTGADSTKGTGTSVDQTQEIDSSIVIMAYNGSTGLNPLDGTTVDQIVGFQIFDHLVKFDKDYNVIPCLAKSWDVSGDGLTYTFKIAEGVKFHNGDTLTMDDIIFSLETYKASPLGYNIDAVGSFRKIDETTLEIVKSDISSKLLEALCLYPCIVNKKVYESDPEGFTNAPVGTGAYKFVSLGDDNSIKMEAFEDYFLGVPKIKEVTFVQPMEESTAAIALETGEIDIISVLRLSQIQTIEDAKGCSVFSEPGPAQCQMMFVGEPFLSNEKLRAAVYHAINPQKVIDIVCMGNGEVAENFYSEALLGEYAGMVDISDRYNPELAKKYLAESGFDTNTEIVFQADAGQAKLAQVIQNDLSGIGLKISIQQVEIPTLVGNVKKSLTPVLIWEAGEMEMSLVDIIQNHSTDGGPLYGVKDKNFDVLAKAVSEEKDLDKRNEKIKEAYKYMVDHYMMYPFFDSLNISAHNDRIQNMHGLGVEYILYVFDLDIVS